MSTVVAKKYIVDKQKNFENQNIAEIDGGISSSSTTEKSPEFTLYLAVVKIYPIDVATLSQGQEIADSNIYQVRADDVLSIHKAIYVFKPNENQVVFLNENGMLTTEALGDVIKSQKQDDLRAIALFQNDFQQYSDYLLESITRKSNNATGNTNSATMPTMLMPQSGRATSFPPMQQQQNASDNQKSLEIAHQMVCFLKKKTYNFEYFLLIKPILLFIL